MTLKRFLFQNSDILKSLVEKKSLSIMVVKVLNTIPVPITVIKKPVILDGIFSFTSKIISKIF
jgi:hypothetical protein